MGWGCSGRGGAPYLQGECQGEEEQHQSHQPAACPEEGPPAQPLNGQNLAEGKDRLTPLGARALGRASCVLAAQEPLPGGQGPLPSPPLPGAPLPGTARPSTPKAYPAEQKELLAGPDGPLAYSRDTRERGSGQDNPKSSRAGKGLLGWTGRDGPQGGTHVPLPLGQTRKGLSGAELRIPGTLLRPRNTRGGEGSSRCQQHKRPGFPAAISSREEAGRQEAGSGSYAEHRSPEFADAEAQSKVGQGPLSEARLAEDVGSVEVDLVGGWGRQRPTLSEEALSAGPFPLPVPLRGRRPREFGVRVSLLLTLSTTGKGRPAPGRRPPADSAEAPSPLKDSVLPSQASRAEFGGHLTALTPQSWRVATKASRTRTCRRWDPSRSSSRALCAGRPLPSPPASFLRSPSSSWWSPEPQSWSMAGRRAGCEGGELRCRRERPRQEQP